MKNWNLGIQRKFLIKQQDPRNTHVQLLTQKQMEKIKTLLISCFLIFHIYLSKLAIFNLKFGFLVKNCVYRQLGMSRIIKFDEKQQKKTKGVILEIDDVCEGGDRACTAGVFCNVLGMFCMFFNLLTSDSDSTQKISISS